MSIKGKSSLVVLLVLSLAPTSFAAEDPIKSGYDLYHNIQRMNDPKESPEQLYASLITTGFLMGFIDGVVLMQQAIYESVLPRRAFSEEESKKMSEKLNLRRINLPDGGLALGQVMLIYKKYAEKHPEGLNGSAKICVFEALVEAYGWK